MGIVEFTDKRGKKRLAVRKRWPDGSELFRYVDNRTIGKKLLSRVNESITMGTWRSLKHELSRGVKPAYTVRTFYDRFMAEYCRPRLVSWGRYAHSFKTLNASFGDVPLRDFNRKHLHVYIESRKGRVADRTINADVAAIKKMFSYAFEVGEIEVHPLVRFKLLPVQEKAPRIPTREEFMDLVNATESQELRALVVLIGETGLRKSEALNLMRPNMDLNRMRITIENTKGKRVRYIPLTRLAAETLSALPVFISSPYVFVHQTGPRKGKRMLKPWREFDEARKRAGLEWLTLHRLRHYRATAWLHYGADIRSVQEKLGHQDVRTTMRYARVVESGADRAVRAAYDRELADGQTLETKRGKNGGQPNGKR